MRGLLLAVSPLALVASVSVARTEPAPPPEAPIGTFGFDETGMDRSVTAGDNFYAYANGSWARNTAIPTHLANYGMFAALDDLSKERVRAILDKERGDPVSLIGLAYASYLDTATVEARGLAPIRPWLEEIKGLRDRKGYSALVGEAIAMGVGGPFEGGGQSSTA